MKFIRFITFNTFLLFLLIGNLFDTGSVVNNHFIIFQDSYKLNLICIKLNETLATICVPDFNLIDSISFICPRIKLIAGNTKINGAWCCNSNSKYNYKMSLHLYNCNKAKLPAFYLLL